VRFARISQLSGEAADIPPSHRKVGGLWQARAMLGALLVGLVAGIVARMILPFDVFRRVHGPRSWGISLLIGLAGAILGWLFFTAWIGIGDTDVFDWGGIIGAILGAVVVLFTVNWTVRIKRVFSRAR
jgi:uncharacterized membrane protein YeaQ/YmgE (transglycosylase-associated protein family)